MMRTLFAASAVLCTTACSTLPSQRAQPVEVQILAINDFHGNLEPPNETSTITVADGTQHNEPLGGVAALASTLERLRAGRRNTITVSAGDLIGASPFTSAHFLDEPTIVAMNKLGLSLNAVGNHEFDKGTSELLRMQSGWCEKYTRRRPCAVEQFRGARFRFLAANVRTADGQELFQGTSLARFRGIRIGFIGMTLKETGTLVTPSGVAGLTFTDEAEAANARVPQLKAEGADAIVLLIHQGGKVPGGFRETGCDGLAGPILGIMDKLDPAISLVISGHTHNAYACELQRGGASRLLTSAGKYGYFVSDIRLSFSPSSHALIAKTARNVSVAAARDGDPAVAAVVRRYAAAAAPAAARVVGRLSAPAPKGVGNETQVANLVADAQLAATRDRARGGADLSFLNDSGVRTGINPSPDGSVTYGQIFAAQPFGNNIVVMTLTGAQLKSLLEQQFKVEDGVARVSSMLVPSANFAFSYDLSKPEGQRIVSTALNGKPIDPAASYRVTVNNFLASGGDGFSVFTHGADVFDAGLDLDALEAWLATNPPVPPIGRTRDVTPASAAAARQSS